MKRGRSIILLGIGIVLSLVSLTFISVSIGSIRDSVWFGRILDRIERDGPTPEHLAEAAEYARRPSDWRRLLRIAWTMPEPQRWENVAEYALLAAERFPRDDSWLFFGVFGLVRAGEYETAQDIFSEYEPRSELAQKLAVLTVLDPDAPDGTQDRLAAFAEGDDSETILRAIGTAVRDKDATAWYRAGEETGVDAFFLQSGLAAATTADRDAAIEVGRILREQPGSGGLAEVYLAAWLRDSEWFFAGLQFLGGREAVQPPVLLMQTDFLVEQSQFDRARPLYRELQERYPRFSAISFGNDALIEIRSSPFPDNAAVTDAVDKIYSRGIGFHPGDSTLRLDYAAYLVTTGRRLAAVQALVPLGPLDPALPYDDETMQRHWLLARTVLGNRAPFERLEADLWGYINRDPDSQLVVRFLARLFLVRNDTHGLADLRRRYPPETAPWAATIHAIEADAEGRYGDAERLFNSVESSDGLYNRALFALRHDDLAGAEDVVDRLEGELDNSDLELRTETAMLRAELSRLRGDIENAREIVERAIQVNPYYDTVYSYRSILARLP